ncbi:MAG: hypothetical protein Q9160_003489 [Pyrenula sp. 1 TL-2023]
MNDTSARAVQPSNFDSHPFYEPIGHAQNDLQRGTVGWKSDFPERNGFFDGAAGDHAPKEAVGSNQGNKKSSNQSIASFLRIPEAIDPNGGSLAELAAEVTCLFWFESATLLHHLERGSLDPSIPKSMTDDAAPTMGFRKWVTTILSTTQVTQNVIILALLFIYRLKNINPQVCGKQGSEFRLLTIALMLGNKFLDDNTYTNKTWAEVSGISVSEIHIMEVEFLSNMRYNLYVSESEWQTWQTKLRKFRVFLKNVSKLPSSFSLTPKLPSPPSPLRTNVQEPRSHGPLVNSITTNHFHQISPTRMFPDSTFGSRKRSLETHGEEPPTKRHVHLHTGAESSNSGTAGRLPAIYPPTTSALPITSHSERTSTPAQQPLMHPSRVPRLPMPRIQTAVDTGTSGVSAWNNQLPLPNSRAMSTVYPTPSTWTQPSLPTTPINASAPPSMNSYPASLAPLADPAITTTSFPHSVHTSPINPTYSSLTPTSRLSPSVFLTNRNSPYRPIRSVNTLLYPPPSASLQNPSRRIGFDQMHYQPLSKNVAERKSGVVPYMHQDPWTHPYTMQPTPGTQPGF